MRHLFLLLLLFSGSAASAQNYESRIHRKVRIGDTTQLHQLILLDYTKLLGTALEIAGDTLRFRLRNVPEVSAIPLGELRFLGEFQLREARGGGYHGPGPGFSDLTYERTALPFHSDGKVKIINLLYAVTEWNLDDHLQLGAGLAGPLGVLLNGRLRYSLGPDVHVGLSAQTLYLPLLQFDNEFVLVGDLTTMLTVGDDRRFLNLGSGLLFTTEDRETNLWVHRAGVGGRLSPKVHLYAEALISLNEDEFFGVRERQLTLLPSVNVSLGARRHRWRFGVATIFIDEDNFFPPPLPYVGYSRYW